VIKGLEVEIVEKIKKARNKNEDVVRIVEEMKKTNVKELQGRQMEDGRRSGVKKRKDIHAKGQGTEDRDNSATL